MKKFSSSEWQRLIKRHREKSERYIELCRQYNGGFQKFRSSDIASLVLACPEVAKECPLYRMSSSEWKNVAEKYPQLLSLYTKQQKRSEKSKFDLKHFIEVIKVVPPAAREYVDWSQFSKESDSEDWKSILDAIPELGEKFGKIQLPDDLLEAMDFIVLQGNYNSEKYNWTNWRHGMTRHEFSKQEIERPETEYFERFCQNPSLMTIFPIVETLELLFNSKYNFFDPRFDEKAANQWFSIVEKYCCSCPFIVTWGLRNYTLSQWERVLRHDYERFREYCFTYFPAWFKETEIPAVKRGRVPRHNFHAWQNAAMAYFSNSMLMKNDHERLAKNLEMFWQWNEDNKKRKKANAARRRKLPNY